MNKMMTAELRVLGYLALLNNTATESYRDLLASWMQLLKERVELPIIAAIVDQVMRFGHPWEILV